MARITISGMVWGTSRRVAGEDDAISVGNAAEAAPSEPAEAFAPEAAAGAPVAPAPEVAPLEPEEAFILPEPVEDFAPPVPVVEVALPALVAPTPDAPAPEGAPWEAAPLEAVAEMAGAPELPMPAPEVALPTAAASEPAMPEPMASEPAMPVAEAAPPEPAAVMASPAAPQPGSPAEAIVTPLPATPLPEAVPPAPATSAPTARVVTAEPATLDPERQAQARRYARQRQALMLVNLGISAAVIAVLLFSGLGFALRDGLTYALGGAAGWLLTTGWHPVLVGAYFGVLFLVILVIDLPLSYYGGFVLPQRYGLSTQTLRGWIGDQAKGQALSLVFELAAVEVLYLLLAAAPLSWWLWAGMAVLVVTVLLANLAPILLLPLFYKLTPLPEGDVRRRTLELAARANTRVRGVFAMNLSAKTTAANAAVMGLGNTRRIVIGDTLLDRYTPDEIEVVVAHELGHQVHWDIPKLVAVQAVTTLGGLYLANVVLHAVVDRSHAFLGLTDVATMPLVAAVLGVFGLIVLPLANGFSRYVEHQADVYALELTGKTDAFIGAMTRLANQNLAELEPSPIVEFLLYDHPSTGRRLAFAREWAEGQSGGRRVI